MKYIMEDFRENVMIFLIYKMKVGCWCWLVMVVGVGVVFVLFVCVVVDSGCVLVISVFDVWVVLFIVNYIEMLQVGLCVEMIVVSILKVCGFFNFKQYLVNLNSELLFELVECEVVVCVLDWVCGEKVCYVLIGVVDEWCYKVGVDGELVVGIMLQVIDVQIGNVIWSVVGSCIGWSCDVVLVVVQKLLCELLLLLGWG